MAEKSEPVVKIYNSMEAQVGEGLERLITKAARSVFLMEESMDCEVSILLTDDFEMRRLNRIYRGVDGSTDVLAFAMREGEDGDLNREILGDVVVSVPTAQRQAETYGHSSEVEILFLVSHGLLHLLGYEHDEKDDMLVMQSKQEEILRSLGYDVAELGDLTVRIEKPVNGVERQVIKA